MTDSDLLTIGRFGRLSGLTVDALRHYDAEGVLAPAHVDPDTGYRRYARRQVDTARAIAAMRDLDLPLPAIRELFQADGATRDALLRSHRSRLEARAFRLHLALHHLRMMTPAGEPVPGPSSPAETSPSLPKELHVPTLPAAPALDVATHRSLGIGLYNRTWELLEIEARTAAQDDELVHTAHASAHHWSLASQGVERARSEWLCSRVYAVLGRGAEAAHHARRCLAILAAGPEGLKDWDEAAASEAMARALAVSGDAAGAADWKARTLAAIGRIADPEDRAVIETDLATLPA